MILFFIANAIALPLLLAIYQHSNGVRIDLGALIANVHGFKILFANPFPGYSPLIKFSYHLIYWHRYWQPVFGIVVAAIASLFLAKRYPSTIPWLIFILSTLATIYLTSTLFVYKDIIAHEQHEFALRLLQSLYLGAAPILALLISPLLRAIRASYSLLAATITLSWYFSYPQYNAKAASYSPSVSAADIAAVHTIEAMSGAMTILSYQIR
ncbi:MAG: hypothetical protein IPG80_03450 [Anaerolineales bacterium]|uniref:hypothetical protein n=1 Tax=Candidatus Villigracilis vicinus TaxID=3140679 RepID=UPI003136EEBE|nr:hypothetical protein [Anaerolineales bacterium]